jgi:hypothetical protein
MSGGGHKVVFGHKLQGTYPSVSMAYSYEPSTVGNTATTTPYEWSPVAFEMRESGV